MKRLPSYMASLSGNRVAVVALLAVAGCAGAPPEPAPAAPAAPEPVVAEAPPEGRFTDDEVAAHVPPDWGDRLRVVYGDRDGAPFFLDGPRLNALGEATLTLLAEAWTHAIPRPADWSGAHDEALAMWRQDPTDRAAAVALDAWLYIRVRQVEEALHERRRLADPKRLLVREPIDVLVPGLLPTHPVYRALRDRYLRYLEQWRRGELTPVDGLPGWTVRLGRRHPSLRGVRLRLAREGFGRHDTDEPERLDATLRERLRRYQKARGLEVTGRLDGPTQRALQEPAEGVLRRVELGMARWHASQARRDGDHIYVNVPSYEVHLVEDGEVTATYPAVVGKPYYRTPVPKVARMGWVVSRPVFFGAGDEVPIGPGDMNPLGELAIRSERWHDLIYLHGTNRKDLFREPYRAYSKGCIRLYDPVALAAYLLDRDPAPEDGALLRDLVRRHETRKMQLADSVAVYFEYNTVHAASDGEHVVFAPDIYRLDVQSEGAVALHPPVAASWGEPQDSTRMQGSALSERR